MLREPHHLAAGRPKRLVALLALAAGVCALACGCDGGDSALPESSGQLRYDLVAATRAANFKGSVVVADLDGDGVDEEVKYDEAFGGASFLSAARIRGDQFYALATRHLMSSGGVCGFAEVTGDSVPELIWWWHATPERVNVFASEVAVEGATATLSNVSSIELDTTGSLLPNGQWGATVSLIGSVDLDGDGAADAVALAVNAGITKEPREVLLWDVENGEVRWRLPTGATPSGASAVVDVDGDGRAELVLGLESPGNGVSAGDWNDGHSYVIAVDTDGQVLWSRQLGGYSSNVELIAEDLDGDGSIEVVTALNYHSELDAVSPELTVWSGADGTRLDTLRVGCPANAIVAGRCDEGQRIFVGSSDGELRRIRWEVGTLEVESQLNCRDAVESVATAVFHPVFDSWSLVVGTGKGTVAVLNEQLSPLAVVQMGEAMNSSRCISPTNLDVSGEPTGGILVRTADRTHRLHLTKRPLPLWMRVVLPALVILAVAALVPQSRRAALAALRRWLLPRDTRDESVEELLTALTTAGHGKLAATSTLRHLRRQSEMFRSQEGDLTPQLQERFRDAVSNARDVGIPGVATIARLSERVGIAPAHARGLSLALEKLRALIKNMPATLPNNSDAASFESRLDEILPVLDETLRGIKSSAEAERSSSLGVELGRALSSRRSEFEKLEVELETPNPAALKSARVLGTSSEITLVLDNLLGNALSAMEDTPVRSLRVSVEVGPRWVVLVVEDSGKGIPESRHEQIFTRGV
ncbi:MAG: ATP-binding protein, partial [Candidatus Eisenbacteria bacterium]